MEQVGTATDVQYNTDIWTFKHPQKCIVSARDVELFRESSLFRHLIDFITQLSLSLKGYPVDPHRLEAAPIRIKQLVHVLDVLDQWIDDIPPIAGAMRFGNKAFQRWFDRLQEVSRSITAR